MSKRKLPKWWLWIQGIGVVSFALWFYSLMNPHELMRSGWYIPVFVQYFAWQVVALIANLRLVDRKQ